MPTKLSRCQAIYVFSAVLISWPGSTVAAQAQREPGQPEAAKESATSTSGKAVGREPWHLIRIPDPLARRATIAALESASAQLADADCRKILTDFDDGNGRSLADRLSSVADNIRGSISPWSRSSTTRATEDAPAESWCSPLLAAAWCVSALKSSNRSTRSSPTTWSRPSFTRSCTPWDWARTRHPPGRSRHACSRDAAGSRRAAQL